MYSYIAAVLTGRAAIYRGLVVVGSPKTLWANDNWYKWLQWVKENKAVLHSDRIHQSVDCVPGI